MSIQRRNSELVDLLRPDFVGNDGTASPTFTWVCVAAGTAAAPGFRFCADPDTGFYRRGANEIGIATQGIARGYWGPGLNIGTATGAPGGRVRIGAGTPNLRLCDTNAGSDQAVNGLIEFYRGVATNRVAYVAMDSLTNDIFAIATEYANGEIRLRTGNGVDAVIIDKNQAVAVTGSLNVGTDEYLTGSHRASVSVGVRVYRDADFVHNNTGNWLQIDFNQQRWDDPDDDQWVIGTPTRLTCQFDGIYVISGHIIWASHATGDRILSILLNGATILARVREFGLTAAWAHQSIATVYKLSVGDFVELEGFQNSGGNLNIVSAGNYSPEFSMVRVA